MLTVAEESKRPKDFEYHGAKVLDGKVPTEIKTLLTLTNIKALKFVVIPSEVDAPKYFWELTTGDGLRYVRVDEESLVDDDAWRQLVGMLLDYKIRKTSK